MLIVVSTLGSVFAPVTAITKAASASTGFFAMIDTPAPSSTGLKEPEASAQEDIIFKDVTFSYPSRAAVKVLDKANIVFTSGQTTAIVGPSGSGKSTIVGLLERWYNIDDPHWAEQTAPTTSSDESTTEKTVHVIEEAEKNHGSITIGGRDIQTLDTKWWRSQIGLVQQEPFTFSTSIYENVAYGLIGSKWEFADEETKLQLVKEACEEAYADEFISRLPLVSLATVQGDQDHADNSVGVSDDGRRKRHQA